MRKLFVLILALTLAACASTNGNQADQEKVSKFVKGKTTYAEVVAALGEPSSVTTDGDGNKTLSYSGTKQDANLKSYIPVVGGFLGGNKTNLTQDYFTFNKKHILVTQYSSNSNF